MAVRAVEMQIGQQYEMQRSPTCKTRRVTLLDKDAPSGRSHWVLVRIEEGISAGKEKEVSSQSLYPLPGAPPPRHRKAKKSEKPERRVPLGWMPEQGDAVVWTQTLGSRFTVLSVDPGRGIAWIEGVVMGMIERFDAPVSELSPFEPPALTVFDSEVEERLGDRLPEVRTHRIPLTGKPPSVESTEPDEDVIDRLVFSPNCIRFYRQRFARRCDLRRAEEQLRSELQKAKRLRRHPRREYLRLRVQRRFDVVLSKRPIQGDFESCYVRRLQLPAKSKRSRRAA
jgi:hypothetical protein